MPASFDIKDLFLKKRFSRRMVFLFLFVALVPIIISSLLAINYVSKLLLDNAYKQMHQESKLYGMTINDKLVAVDHKLKKIAASLSSGELSARQLKNQHFDDFTIVAVRLNNKETRLIPSLNNTLPVFPVADKEDKKSHLFVNPANDNDADIYMNARFYSDTAQKTAFVTAKLNPLFLWGSKDDLPFDQNICIFEDSYKKLFCSDPFGNTNLPTIIKTLDGAETPLLKWQNEKQDYLAVNWPFYLKTRFNSQNWMIVTSQKESHVLQPIHFFNKIFVLIIVLIILIVVLISLSQIRRSLVPLQHLVAGTNRIADNDFSMPIAVNSHDEFEDLSDSFNVMATRLESQFNFISVLSEIDKLILLEPENEKIIISVLDGIQKSVPNARVNITLIENDKFKLGQTYHSEKDKVDSKQVSAQSFFANDLRIFLAESDSGYFNFSKDADKYFNPYNKASSNSAYIFPIVVKAHLSALIYIGYDENFELGDIEIKQINEFKNRLAIAINAADKDRMLYQQSNYDYLTKLPNRHLFIKRLEQEIVYSKRKNKQFALFFVDIDHFKKINDNYGHIVGDQLLQQVATRLKIQVNAKSTIARLAGDEFIIICSDILEAGAASLFAKTLLRQLEKPFYIDDNEIVIKASIGIAIYPVDGDNISALLKNSDTAMYKVKSSGRGNYLYFNESMNEIDKEEVLEKDLLQALNKNEFELYYQPMLKISSDKSLVVDTKLRWNHPKLGNLPLSKFISYAEKNELMDSIGEWMIDSACHQYALWKKQGVELQILSISISNQQLLQKCFEGIVAGALRTAGMNATSLELNITENVLADNRIKVLAVLKKLTAMGITISIDDFSASYSAFNYLTGFPVKKIRLDRSYLNLVPGDEYASDILRAIITMAHSLDFEIIIDGIESEQQYAYLSDNKCDYGQGYFLSPALPAQQFVEYALSESR